MSLATITLDTHIVIKQLLRKGYTEDQAEGFVEAMKEINLTGVATKSDIDNVREDLSGKISSLRDEISNLRVEIKAEKAELYKFMLMQGMSVVGLTVGLTVGLIKLLS